MIEITFAQLRIIMKKATKNSITAQKAKFDLIESTEEMKIEIIEKNENEEKKNEEKKNEKQDSESEHQLSTFKKETHVLKKMLQKTFEEAHVSSTLKNYKEFVIAVH